MNADTSSVDAAAYPHALEYGEGNCPACGMGGLTRDQALVCSPIYMAAADAMEPMAVPDEPAVECWSCRRLRATGQDPVALRERDRAERALHRRTHDGGIVVCGDIMYTRSDGSHSIRTCGRCRSEAPCGEILERDWQGRHAVFPDGIAGPLWEQAVEIAEQHGCTLTLTQPDGADLRHRLRPGDRAPSSAALRAMIDAGIRISSITVGAVAPQRAQLMSRLPGVDL